MIADLDAVKTVIGARTMADDGILALDLETATAWVYDRTYPCLHTDAEVQMGIVLLTARLYKRRQSPDGLAGWTADGIVAHIAATDPDIRSLLTRKLDMTQAGIG